MNLSQLLAAPALIGLLTLSGCVRTRYIERPIQVPDTMFMCLARPEVPEDAYTDNDVAEYLVELALSAEDCKNELETEVPRNLQELGVEIIQSPKDGDAGGQGVEPE